MKNKEKKVPKGNDNDYIVSSSAEAVLYGILFALLGIIGLLNKGIVGSFLTYWIVYLFGAFYILFFLFMIFFGLYLIIKKRFYRLKIDLKLLGFLLMLISFSIGASLRTDLRFSNFYNIFSMNMESIKSSSFAIASLSQVPLVGGGLIGYALAATLNNCVTPFGTKIVIAFLLIVGFLLVFHGVLKYMFKQYLTFHKKRKELRKLEYEKEKEKEAIKKNQEQEKINENVKKEIKASNEEVIPMIKREPLPSPSQIFVNEEEVEKKQDFNFFNDEKEDYSYVDENKKIPLEVDSFFDDEKEENVVEENFKEEIIQETPLFADDNEQNNLKIINNKNIEVAKKIKMPYIYPPISLLSEDENGDKTALNFEVADGYVRKINELFNDFKIGAQVISYTIGPSVTRFDVKTNPGVKLSSLASIQNELAAKLEGNKTVRVELIVEGKDTSGIEVGNKFISTVPFKEVMKDLSSDNKDKLLIPLGKDISGNIVKTSIGDLPHLLVAGTTGSGKSVFIHSIIMTLLMRNNPDELRLMLIDPKRVEFSKYHDLPHLLCPTITDQNEANVALKRLVDEMERRYDVFATKGNGASKYSEYMEYAKEHNLELMPIIIVIIDEFADLMLSSAKDVEISIQRIGQKARACGIHLILATQRPSVQVVTGDIKANIPSRIALSVASQTDSRVIIDEVGAETLLGKGDLLARVPISKALIRAQSPYISNKDIITICDYIRSHGEVNYFPQFLNLKENPFRNFDDSALSSSNPKNLDPLYYDVKNFVLDTKTTATNRIQAKFGIGANRADKILIALEEEGILRLLPNGRREIIGESNGKK